MKKKGQVTLLAVILGVLGLTVGLAVASRSLSDLRSATNVDIGTKALAAAEAGVEFGLNKINVDPSGAANCNAELPNLKESGGALEGLSDEIESVKVEICFERKNALRSSGEIEKDDVYQIDLTAGGGPGKLGIVWSGTGGATGIEVAILKNDYSVERNAFRAQGQLPGSNFTEVAANRTCAGLNGYGTDTDVISVSNAVLVRIKPIGGPAEIAVCPDSGEFPPQFYEIMSTASTKNGTMRKVRVTRDVSGTLPGIFDNVLYSGGSIIKS